MGKNSVKVIGGHAESAAGSANALGKKGGKKAFKKVSGKKDKKR